MPAPTIYYIRHGETDWNAAGRFQGTQDIALNATGREQARAAGAILRDLLARDAHEPTALHYVASPLARARVTMDLLRAEIGLPTDGYALDPRLREVSYGAWEGLTVAEMQRHDPAQFEARQNDKWGVGAPGGEAYASATERVRAWHDDLFGVTVAVAHGGTMRALMVALGVTEPRHAVEQPIAQGAVYVFSGGRMTKYA
jgi:probable phosphoglycerate mutase